MGVEARTNAAARERQAAEFREHIAQAIPPHRHQLIDAYGRPIVVGGTYAFTAQYPTPVTVIDVQQNLHPNAPPGAYTVTVMAQLTLQAMSRAPIRNMILIHPGEAVAQGEEETQDKAQQPPAEERESTIAITDFERRPPREE